MTKNKTITKKLDKLYEEKEFFNRQKAQEQHLQTTAKILLSNFTDYFNNAKTFLQIQPLHYNKQKILWSWNNNLSRWEMIDETDLVNKIKDVMEPQAKSTILPNSIKSQIFTAVKSESRLTKPLDTPKTWVQFKDTIVDVMTGEEFPASPEYFITNPIPWDLGDTDETPTIDKIFTEWVGEEWKQTLYEIIAYSMLPDYPLSLLFVLVGGGSNGKTVFLKLLSKIVGFDNTTTSDLKSLMTQRFEKAKLHKKLLCVMGETDYADLKNTDWIKRLTGGDPISFELKGKNPFDDYNYAKIVIATNTLPMTSDKTRGFYRRFIVIDFPNEFPEKIDIISKIPEEEYPALMRKSVKILKDLLQRREFTNQGTIEERMSRYEMRSNPVSIFIDNFCDRTGNHDIPFSEFKTKFYDFCKLNDFNPPSDIMVGKGVRNEGFILRRENVKNEKYVDEPLEGHSPYISKHVIKDLRWRES